MAFGSQVSVSGPAIEFADQIADILPDTGRNQVVPLDTDAMLGHIRGSILADTMT